MDIEGAEIEAVKGSSGVMKRHKVNFAIATYHVLNGEKTYIPLEKLFKKMGYKSKTEKLYDFETTYAW